MNVFYNENTVDIVIFVTCKIHKKTGSKLSGGFIV